MKTGYSFDVSMDPDAFIDQLKPGDVVLFDSLHPLSALIQFAENRPVSHAGLYLGNGEFAQVSRESEKHPAAARIESLNDRLKLPYDQTVTALRHIDVIGGEKTDLVVKRAHDYTDTVDTKYAYLGLITLMVPALFRTYEGYFDAGSSMTQRIGSVLETLSQAMLTVFEPDSEIVRQSAGFDKKTLTCSEFVYRCFMEADRPFPIALPDPLFAYRPAPSSDGSVLHDRDASDDALGGDPDGGALILSMHRSLTKVLVDTEDGNDSFAGGGGDNGFPATGQSDWDREIDELLGSVRSGSSRTGDDGHHFPDDRHPLPVGSILVESSSALDVSRLVNVEPERSLGGRDTRRQLAAAAVQVVKSLVARNVGLDKYGTFRPGPGVDPSAVLPDTVTPKDLWSSESLIPVSIFHRPPGHDSRLDEVQRH
jgi:hypothetical protein